MSGSLKRQILIMGAVAAFGAGSMYFVKNRPWIDCASHEVEVQEFGRAIRPSEDFMLPHDHEKRLQKVREVNAEIEAGRVPSYVLRRCGPKPEPK